jgi:hypothetical protein
MIKVELILHSTHAGQPALQSTIQVPMQLHENSTQIRLSISKSCAAHNQSLVLPVILWLSLPLFPLRHTHIHNPAFKLRQRYGGCEVFKRHLRTYKMYEFTAADFEEGDADVS